LKKRTLNPDKNKNYEDNCNNNNNNNNNNYNNLKIIQHTT